jgi:transposase
VSLWKHLNLAQNVQSQKLAEYEWLNQVSAVPIQQALRHLTTAYTNFFEARASKPTFKKKEVRNPPPSLVTLSLGIVTPTA